MVLLANIDNKTLFALTYNNIASIYLNQQLFQKACMYSEQSLNTFEPYVCYF